MSRLHESHRRVTDAPYHWFFGGGVRFWDVDIGHAVIDISAFLIFACTALVANRMYPLWLASVQLVAVVAHVVRDISPAINGGAYAIMMIFPSYIEIAILTGGLVAHRRRLAKFGPYRSWLLISRNFRTA